MAGDIWIFEPVDHKTRWRGHRKLIPLGPRAQEIIRPYLNRVVDAYLFSPIEAQQWRNERRRARPSKRKTPIYPSELRAREKAKQARKNRKPDHPIRDHYDTHSFGKAINFGIQKAEKAGVEVPHWHPNQLRHSRGTEIRKEYGVEGAQVILGHVRADVTQIYAQKNLELAMRIAKETG